MRTNRDKAEIPNSLSLTLSLSQTYTHTHTHTFSLCVKVRCVRLCLCVCLKREDRKAAFQCKNGTAQVTVEVPDLTTTTTTTTTSRVTSKFNNNLTMKLEEEPTWSYLSFADVGRLKIIYTSGSQPRNSRVTQAFSKG